MNKRVKRPLLRVPRHDREALGMFANGVLSRDKRTLDAYYEYRDIWIREDRGPKAPSDEDADNLFDFATRQPQQCLSRIPREVSSINEGVVTFCLRELVRRNDKADDSLLEAIAGSIFLARVSRRPNRVKELVHSQVRLMSNGSTPDETATRSLKAFFSITADMPLFERVVILERVLTALFDELDSLEGLRSDLCQSVGMPMYLQNIMLRGTYKPLGGTALFTEPDVDDMLDAVIIGSILELPSTHVMTIVNLLNTVTSSEAATYTIGLLCYIHGNVFLKQLKKRFTKVDSEAARNKILSLFCQAQAMDTTKGHATFLNDFDRITDLATKRRTLRVAVLRTNQIAQLDIILQHLLTGTYDEDDRQYLIAALVCACKDN